MISLSTLFAVTAFLSAHWDTIQAVIGAGGLLHIVASVVVNLTDTPADDAALAKFYRAVEVVGGIVTKKAKR